MSEIEPFEIHISDADLDDLNARLERTRFPEAETPDDWSQGIPLSYMKEIQKYWLSEYNWPKRLELLNQWPGFKTELDGLGIPARPAQMGGQLDEPLAGFQPFGGFK